MSFNLSDKNADISSSTDGLVSVMQRAGLNREVIQAAWPSWWSNELAEDPSGQAELRFSLARRLGLSPKSLLRERAEFLWQDEACFKHLSTEDPAKRATLTSFGIAIGQLLVRATPQAYSLVGVDALSLRKMVLACRESVDLVGLLSVCWAVGIPVIHLQIFPLATKSMHAMVVRIGERYAILLGRDASYPAPVAFSLAHELGHILLGHLSDAPALVELKDPATSNGSDIQETEADQFGLILLTASPKPSIQTTHGDFNASSLARAALKAAPQHGVEAGTLALIIAHALDKWPVAMTALKFIYDSKRPVWKEVNGIADTQLAWDEISNDAADYVRKVMSLHD